MGRLTGARRFAGLAFKPGVTQNMVMMRPTSAPKLDPASYFNSWRGWPAELGGTMRFSESLSALSRFPFPVPSSASTSST